MVTMPISDDPKCSTLSSPLTCARSRWFKTVRNILALLRLAPLRTASLKSAPRRSVLLRKVPRRLALPRLVLLRLALLRSGSIFGCSSRQRFHNPTPCFSSARCSSFAMRVPSWSGGWPGMPGLSPRKDIGDAHGKSGDSLVALQCVSHALDGGWLLLIAGPPDFHFLSVRPDQPAEARPCREIALDMPPHPRAELAFAGDLHDNIGGEPGGDFRVVGSIDDGHLLCPNKGHVRVPDGFALVTGQREVILVLLQGHAAQLARGDERPQGQGNIQCDHSMLAIMHAQQKHQPSLSQFCAAMLDFGEAAVFGCCHQVALVFAVVVFERHCVPLRGSAQSVH